MSDDWLYGVTSVRDICMSVRKAATLDTPAIRLTELRKSFGGVEAVAGVDLEIADGEFFSMLGPSGSGKTTVLRLIAGFELPTAGVVELAGADVTGRAPFERDVNTVFQDYALFPHMSVVDNVEYGLKIRKVGRQERRERAEAALATVRLTGYGLRVHDLDSTNGTWLNGIRVEGSARLTQGDELRLGRVRLLLDIG